MLKFEDVKRERTITREIHKLFWRGVRHSRGNFLLTLLHAPYFFIYHVYIPLEVAFCLQAIVNRQFDMVSGHITRILVSTVLGLIVFAIANLGFNRFGVETASYLQRVIFDNYLNKDYDFFANNYVGSLGLYASRLRQGIIDYSRVLFFDLLKIITIVSSSLVVLLLYSPTLALVTVVCVFVVMSSTIITHSYRLKFRRLTSEADGRVAGVLGDSLSHGTVVKSFATEAYEKERLDKSLREWSKAQLKSWDLGVPTNSFRNLTLIITTVILLSVSAGLYRQGAITLGVIILVQLYVLKLVNSAIEITDVIKEMDATLGSCYQSVATMREPTKIRDPETPVDLDPPQHLHLALENVFYRYPEQDVKQTAVNQLSLSIEPGEKVGVVGYSGSGKTTLSKLVLRFMDVSSGAIKLGTYDIREYAQRDLRRYIAYVPQEPLLFHRTILENISYGNPDAPKGLIEKAAKAAYIDEFVKDLPNGYDTLVGERGIKLSGGQRQRVAIARALLKDSPMLVLDEATSALDSKSEHYIQKALWKLMKNRTTLVIAHRLSTIQRMDRIVVMDKGKIVQVGTHDTLRSTPGIYADLWKHQSGGYIGVPDNQS